MQAVRLSFHASHKRLHFLEGSALWVVIRVGTTVLHYHRVSELALFSAFPALFSPLQPTTSSSGRWRS